MHTGYWEWLQITKRVLAAVCGVAKKVIEKYQIIETNFNLSLSVFGKYFVF